MRPHVYKAANGQWLVTSGTRKVRFATEREARTMEGKIVFAAKIQDVAAQLAQVRDAIADLSQVYGDRKYGTTNAITDADVVSLGVTAAQVDAFIPLANKLRQLMQGQPTTAIAGDAIVNVLRKDV